jgi:hypothetical protein
MPMHYRQEMRATAAYHKYRDRIVSPTQRLDYDLDKIKAGLHPTIFSHDKGAAVNDALADAVRSMMRLPMPCAMGSPVCSSKMP